MFSRSVPPTHCVSGSDSIGKHVSRELIASSARRGVMSVPACIDESGGGVAPPHSQPLLRRRGGGLVNLQLFIETSNNRLQFIDGSVVFLDQNLLLIVRLFLFIGGQLLRILGSRRVHLELETVQVRIHLAVVAIEVVFCGDHLVLGRRGAVGRRIRCARIGASRLRMRGGAKSQNQREWYPSLHRESSIYRY